MPQTLTKYELRKLGMAALMEKLGVVGFIEFLQDLGINRGNWTEERKKIFEGKSVDDIIRDMDKSESPSIVTEPP